MNAERKMLIDVAIHLRASMCRCMPREPVIDWNTGGLVCGKFACPRANKPMLERILQLLGDGDAAAGAALVAAAETTEFLDTSRDTNGDRLRVIVEAEALRWNSLTAR